MRRAFEVRCWYRALRSTFTMTSSEEGVDECAGHDRWTRSFHILQEIYHTARGIASGGTQRGAAEALFVASAGSERVLARSHAKRAVLSCPPGWWESERAFFLCRRRFMRASVCRQRGCLGCLRPQPGHVHWPPRASVAMLADALGHTRLQQH